MQQPKAASNWFFVDEAGDPTFYDKKGNFIVGRDRYPHNWYSRKNPFDKKNHPSAARPVNRTHGAQSTFTHSGAISLVPA